MPELETPPFPSTVRSGNAAARLLEWERDLRRRWRQDREGERTLGRRHLELLGGIVVLAALLRFATLDARGYWVDEAVIVHLVGLGPGEMLERLLSGEEGTPPLYYLLAWAWTSIFGTGEVGLRSLSAVIGTATVPVAYLAGRELVSSRTGLLAALMFALSPILVWHSQDARAHSLAVLVSALSFLFFLRALREPRERTLALWALASAIGLLTHYFVFFLVAVEGAWLLLAYRRKRAVWVAVAAVGVALVGALSIALQQRSNVDLTYNQYGGLASRLVQAPAQILVGEQPPFQRAMPVLAALLVIPALLVVLRRATAAERRAAGIAGAVAALAVAAMVLAALAGVDYVSARNALPVLLPVVLVLACGFGAAAAPRAVTAALGGLLALWLAINVATADVPKFEREDWRGAAEALGPATVDRAIVVTPYPGRGPLRFYLSGTERLGRSPEPLREIDLVGLPPLFRKLGQDPEPPRPARVPPLPRGFRVVEQRRTRYFTVVRARSGRPVSVDRATLRRSHLGDGPPEVLVQSRAR